MQIPAESVPRLGEMTTWLCEIDLLTQQSAQCWDQIFKNAKEISNKFGIDLNLRPQNLSPETYFKIAKEYENLNS